MEKVFIYFPSSDQGATELRTKNRPVSMAADQVKRLESGAGFLLRKIDQGFAYLVDGTGFEITIAVNCNAWLVLVPVIRKKGLVQNKSELLKKRKKV